MRFEEDTDRKVDLNAEPDLSVHCSICLELVETDGRRSTAKLQCGHEFHLDCIGSAFNAKGIMQCPNCRNVEKGQWLYAIGSANVASDFSMDSWIAEQYPFFLVPYGFRICPFRGLMEMDDPSVPGHALYGEQMPPSSSPGLAYFTYFRPPHPHAPLNPNEHMDAPNFTPFDDSNRQNEILASAHVYPTWRHHLNPSSPMIESSHQNLRTSGGELDAATGSRFPGHYFPSFQRRSSNGFPAFLPAGRPYDPRAWFYYPPPYVPNYLHPWGRGVHFPALPSDQWLRHR